jgi:hypothetical protein
MKCIKCGMIRSGKKKFFVCEDCEKFSEIILQIVEETESEISSAESLDIETHDVFKLLTDIGFTTTLNPHTAIFHNLSSVLLHRTLRDQSEVSEEELNKEIRTTRSWADVLELFEDAKLIEIKTERYKKTLIPTKRIEKIAREYYMDGALSDQVDKRSAHFCSGYVMLQLLKKVSDMKEITDKDSLPYGRCPRTLWTIAMFLWTNAFERNEGFDEEQFRKFVGKRGIPTSTWSRIVRGLETADSRATQGMIKQMGFESGIRTFEYEDYVPRVMERLRERGRMR